jgi:hypothetical protein
MMHRDGENKKPTIWGLFRELVKQAWKMRKALKSFKVGA